VEKLISVSSGMDCSVTGVICVRLYVDIATMQRSDVKRSNGTVSQEVTYTVEWKVHYLLRNKDCNKLRGFAM
jgi:hypothetical protein